MFTFKHFFLFLRKDDGGGLSSICNLKIFPEKHRWLTLNQAKYLHYNQFFLIFIA